MLAPQTTPLANIHLIHWLGAHQATQQIFRLSSGLGLKSQVIHIKWRRGKEEDWGGIVGKEGRGV